MMPTDAKRATELHVELEAMIRADGGRRSDEDSDLWDRLGACIASVPFGVVVVSRHAVVANDVAKRLWHPPSPSPRNVEEGGVRSFAPTVEEDGRTERLSAWAFSRVRRVRDEHAWDVVLRWMNEPEEIVVHRPDGSRALALASVVPLAGSDDFEGEVPAVLAVFSSIFDEPEAALRSRAAHRRAAFLIQASTILLSGSLDPDEILRQVAARAVPIIADGCIIDVVDEQAGSDLALRRVVFELADPSRGSALEAVYDTQRDEGGSLRRVVRTARPELHAPTPPAVSAVSKENGSSPPARALAPHSSMIVPLMARRRVVGVVTLIRFQPEYPFEPADLEMAEQFGLNAGLAVENARLFRYEQEARTALERSANRLQRLQSMMSDLAVALTSSDVANAVVTDGLLAFDGAEGLIWKFDEAHRALRLSHASIPMEEARRRYGAIFADASGPVGEAARSRNSIFVSSASEFKARFPESSSDGSTSDIGQDIKALACMPLLVRGRVYGVLGFTFDRSRTFDTEDRSFLELIAAHCAQGLYRASLYEGELRARSETALLYALVDAASRATTMAEVLDTSLEIVRRGLHVERVAILLDDSDGVPKFAASRGLSSSFRSFIERQDSRAFRLFTQRQGLWPGDSPGVSPIFVRDISGDERLDTFWSVFDAEGIRSAAFFPLVHKGQLFGKLVLFHSSSDAALFDDDVAKLAQAIAGQLAQAVVRKRTEADVEEARAAAEYANRMKDEFLAVVSHELRTPLSSITGWASILQTERRNDPATLEKGLSAIARNAKAQATIIEDILDVSRIIRGKLVLDAHPTSLVPIVSETIDTLRTSANAKQIDVQLVAADDRYMLVGDPERIRQVVWNLVSNAIKFTPAHGHVTVTLRREADAVVLEVADTGRGVSPDFLPYVFDRFRQADSSTTRREGGLGLGLSIVRHLVELHGGQVGVRSDGIGKGSTFFVKFPVRAVVKDEDLAPVDEAPTGVKTESNLPPAPTSNHEADLNGVRVLVVDDQPDAREMLSEALSSYGAVVTVAGSAQEAVDVLANYNPEILVTDIGMPDEDGYALLRRVRSLPGPNHELPAIAVTAYAHIEDARRAIRAGFQSHVAKPTRPDTLAHAVAKALGREAPVL